MGYEKINRPLLGEEFNDPTPAAAQVYALGNVATTTIAVANTPVKADVGAIVFVTAESGGVTWNTVDDRIDVGKGRKRLFCATVRGRLEGTNGDILALYVAKNGSTLIQSFAYGEVSSGFGSLTSTSLVELEQGDYIEIFVANELTTNNVTLKDFSLEVHPV